MIRFFILIWLTGIACFAYYVGHNAGIDDAKELQEIKPMESNQPKKGYTLNDLYVAIAKVETNGTLKRGAAGEIGTYQITEAYWRDSGIEGEFVFCWNDVYSLKVMRNYWRRYCLQSFVGMDFETLSRVHRGGPDGANKESTKAYWEKVQAALTKGGE